jgi:hypothetical protein
MTIDRTHASRLLAKCAAYIECGKRETAREYGLQLMAYLGECIDGEPLEQGRNARAASQQEAP